MQNSSHMHRKRNGIASIDNALESRFAVEMKSLELERQRHAQALQAIDEAMKRVKAAADALRRLPKVVGNESPAMEVEIDGVARKGRRFSQTSDESVLHFIRAQGEPTTAEINAHWRAEGRKGVSNSIILRLIKEKRICRVPDPSVRGSRYCVAFQERKVSLPPNGNRGKSPRNPDTLKPTTA